MSQTPEAPALLSPERLAEIDSNLFREEYYRAEPEETAACYVADVRALLAFRQQVATELAGLLKPLSGYESSEAGYLEMLRAKEHNSFFIKLAARLGIELPR